jgi:hypothetical protein
MLLLTAAAVLACVNVASAQEVFIYNNLTNSAGPYYANGGAANVGGNTITTMVADDITPLPGYGGQSVYKIYYSVVNNSGATVSARVNLGFWKADGQFGDPGTFITGFNLGPFSFSQGTSLKSFSPTNGMTVPTGTFWFGISFDNNTNGTTATAAQLNTFGMKMYGPPNIGSSTDDAFQTTSAGSFFASNPSGSDFFFGGSPLADFYFGMSVVAGNLPPVANPQTVFVPENQSVPITLTAVDPDGDTLTYSVVSSPVNGTLSGIAPNVTYTPKANFFGSDSFTFKANDGHTNSGPAVVSISVIPTIGLKINPTFDSTITTDPNVAIITNTIISAIQVFESRFLDPVTVSIQFVNTTSVSLGENLTSYNSVSYSSFYSALSSHSKTTNDALALANIPGGANDPVIGGSLVDVTLPNLRALGFSAPGSPDSTISLNLSVCNTNRVSIDSSKFDLMAVVMHEIDEVLGTASGLTQGNIRPADLFRYSSTAGVRSYTTSGDDAYFSLDGINDLARYNQSGSGDWGDWWTAGTHTPQVQDAFATAGATPNLGVELTVLDVVGWDLFSAVATPVPQFTSIKRTNSTINLTWSTVSGLNYQLLYTANLAPDVWTNLGSSITATGPSASYTDTIGSNQRRFYRVELLNPPSTPSSAPASPALDFSQVPLPPPTLRTNVLLRSMLAPAGRHQSSVISVQ